MIIAILSIIAMIACICGLVFGFESLFFNSEIVTKNDLKFSISAIVLGLSIILIFAIENHFDKIPYEENRLIYTEYITALQDNSEVNGVLHGSRYCVCGYFDEQLYYSYMVERSDGGVISNKVPANNTVIYESDDNFRVEWYIRTKSWLGMYSEIKSWKIYLPKGSITNDYSIDLE